jgi:hypothetical protein
MLCKWRALGIACLTFAAIIASPKAIGQAPPVQRNAFTTNSAATMNLSVSHPVYLNPGGVPTTTGSSLFIYNSLLDPSGSGDVVFSNAPSITSPTLNTSLTLNYATGSTLPVLNSSKQLVSLANTSNGFLLGLSNSAPAWITNISSLYITNLYGANIYAPSVATSMTLSYATATTLPVLNSSKQLVSLAAGTDGQVLTLASGAPAWADAPGGSTNVVNNYYATNISVTNINAQTITLKGKQLGATHLNGTNVYPVINFTNNSDINYAWDGVSNVTETIASGAVTDAKVSSSAGITRSKLASGTANHVLINDGSGVMSSEATLGAARFPALTGDVTTPGGSLATTIANNAVTDAKFRQGVARSVVGVTGNATANTADIQGASNQVLRVNGAGTALAFGAIDLSQSSAATGVVQAASFPALTGDVTTTAGSLATTIAANAVTYAKFQQVSATQRAIGRNTAGAGNAEEVTASQLLDWIGTTRGSILERGASTWGIITPGTSGYILTANGAGADPSWQAAPSSGLSTSASAYAIVVSGSDSNANWTTLSNAYVTAKSATPNGQALAANNRYTIFLMPGLYNLGSSAFTLDTEFIDIIGLSLNSGPRYYISGNTDKGDTILQSSSSTATVNLTVGSNMDVTIANLCLYMTGSGYSINCGSNSGFLARFKCINCFITATSNVGFVPNKDVNGYWEDVRGWDTELFGWGNTTVSGTFVRCKAPTGSFGGSASGANNLTVSGTFIDCEADDGSFGGNNANTIVCSGNFIRCRFVQITGGSGGMYGRNKTFSGNAYQCTAGGSGSCWGGTISGNLYQCSGTGITAGAVITGKIQGCDFIGWRGVLAINTSDSSAISNTTSSNNFSLNQSIAANYWKAARGFEWNAWGKISTDGSTPGTLTLKAQLGTVVLNNTGAMTMLAGASNTGWHAHGIFVCRTTGASGTVSPEMDVSMGPTAFIGNNVIPANGTVTVDTTTAANFQMSAQWNTATTNNTITMENLVVVPLDGN